MSYEPTNWKTGDVVTSAKLNKLEQGVAGSGSGGSVLKVDIDENGVFSKTWKEIRDALVNGLYCVCVHIQEGVPAYSRQMQIFHVQATRDGYSVNVMYIDGGNIATFTAVTDSENGYPVAEQ